MDHLTYLYLGDEIPIEQSPIGGDGFLSNICLLLLVLTWLFTFPGQ